MSASSVQKSRKTAKDYYNEALAASMDEWEIYDADTDGSLDEWLEANLPSKITRQDGIGWIFVGNPRFSQEVDDDIPEDNLLKDWENLKQNGQVNFQSISKLAKRYQCLAGSWMLHVLTGDKVDLSFRKLAHELVHGVLADIARSISVSPLDLSYGDVYKHVILIANSDFTNVDEVYRLERSLRDAGIKTNMLYKPGIYSTLGIYRNNEFGMRPTIYSSDYDVLERASKITITHDEVFETGSSSQVSETDNICQVPETGSSQVSVTDNGCEVPETGSNSQVSETDNSCQVPETGSSIQVSETDNSCPVPETDSSSQVSETDNSCEVPKTGSIRQTFQTLTSAELAEQKGPISEN